jgi:hypothetical protein
MDTSLTTNSLEHQMMDYLRLHFSDVLGEHTHLLEQADDLDKVINLLQTGLISMS